MSYKDWKKITIPSGKIFNHGTTTKANVKCILKNGILSNKSNSGSCTMGCGLYVNEGDDPLYVEDRSSYMIVFQTNQNIDGYEVSIADYSAGDKDSNVNADYMKLLNSSDFYKMGSDYVFHPRANGKIDVVKVVDLHKKLDYSKQRFLQLP